MRKVFISYKHYEKDGTLSEAYEIAKNVYNALHARGVSAFFSDFSIYNSGKSDYKKEIDKALKEASVLLVIATRPEHLESGWIEYEYETFYADILSDRKKGELCSYTKGIHYDNLPRTLSRFQNYAIDEMPVDRLAAFIEKSCGELDGVTASVGASAATEHTDRESSDTLPTTRHKSLYSSDYSNELKRLEIQAKNAVVIDRMALDYVFSTSPWGEDEEIYVLDVGSAYGHVAADRFSALPQVKKVLCVDYNERVIERAQVIFAENTKMIFEVLDAEDNNFTDAIEKLLEKHSFPKVHIVFFALVLHHLKNPVKVLRNVRKIMADDSRIIIRGSDDGSKLCYPNEELLHAIIEKTMTATGVSDRYNGRKILWQLQNSGFRNIRMFSHMKDLSQISYDDRNLLFQESFSYRSNYYQKAVDKDPDNRKAQEDLAWMNDALERFENQFFEVDFWYCEYDYIGVAGKQ